MDYDAFLDEITFDQALEFLKFIEKLEQYSEPISKREAFSFKMDNSPGNQSISQPEIIKQLQQWNVLKVKSKSKDGNYLLLVSEAEFNNFKLALEKSVPALDIVKKARENAQKALVNFVNSGVIQSAFKSVQQTTPALAGTLKSLPSITLLKPPLEPMEFSSGIIVSRDAEFNRFDWELKVRQTKALEKIQELLEQSPNKRNSQILEQLSEEELILPSLPKKDLTNKLEFIRDTKKFGVKEENLLDILGDLKPHRTTALITTIQTKSMNALTKLKNRVNKKLDGTGFRIVTTKGDWSNPKGFYQLKYLTDFDYGS